jgi:hypothetical protein
MSGTISGVLSRFDMHDRNLAAIVILPAEESAGRRGEAFQPPTGIDMFQHRQHEGTLQIYARR